MARNWQHTIDRGSWFLREYYFTNENRVAWLSKVYQLYQGYKHFTFGFVNVVFATFCNQSLCRIGQQYKVIF